MKKKNLKRSFLLSVLSLLLCVSMFVGTTFAWFSETITNQKNKIMAGNLDVALYYMTEDMADWEEVDENTVIFPEDALWEPGYTQVVYFKVVNEGTLALKYQFGLSVLSETTGTNVDGDTFKLSEFIKFGVVEGTTHAPFADRADAIAKVDANSKKISEGFTKPGELVAATATTPSEEYVSMAVYMPTTVENEANYKTGTVAPTINLGIELYATQMMNEEDAFGPDYDEDARLPATKTESVVAGTETVVENDFGSATIPADATTAEELTFSVKEIETPATITVATGETTKAFEVSLVDENGDKVTTTEPIETSLYIGKNLIVSKLYHNDQEIDFTYNATTGYITFETTSFSPFTVVTKDVTTLDGIATADELVAAAAKGGYYNVAADIDLGTTSVKIPAGISLYLNMNGKTISATDTTEKNFGMLHNNGTLTIAGTGKLELSATVNSGWNRYSSVISNNPGGKLVVDGNVVIEHLGGTDMSYAIDNLTNGKGTYAETVINGGTIKSTYRAIRQFLNGVEAQNILTINGGTVEGANKSVWMQDPNKNANTGTLTISDKAVLKGDLYLFVTAGSTEWPVTVSIAAEAVGEYEVLSGNVPEGYAVVKSNGAWVVKAGTAVSTADELAAALAADKTVILTADINMDVAATGFTVAKGTAAKIDLNGHDIIATSTSAESVQLFSVNGELEIVGEGTISLTNPDYAWTTSYRYTAINVREAGVVTLGEGVEVICTAGENTEKGYGMTYAVDIYTTGTLNVNGASLHSNYIAVRCFYGASVVNVNSGSITSSKNNWGIWPQSADNAVITIADGISYITDEYGIYIFG